MEMKTYQLPAWMSRFIPSREVSLKWLSGSRSAATARHRAYAGAESNNMTFSWSSEEYTADQVVYNDLAKLRGRSREQVRNNSHARKFVKLVGDNVIGHMGITMQANIITNAGIRNKMDSDTIERHWRIFSKRGGCDVTGRLSLIDLQTVAAKGWATDGEAIVRKHRRGAYGIQFELVDPVLLDVRFNADLSNGNRIRMGIEVDSFGKPLAYHLSDPKQQLTPGYLIDSVRVPADEIEHIFHPELVGQSRGLPQMATALLRLNMLEGYSEAALVNAREGASNMMYFTAPDGGEAMVPDGIDANGDPFHSAEPGSKRILPPGYGMQQYDPAYPNGEIADFNKLMLREIAAGLGVDYVGLSGDLEGVNYSSIRAGVLETREAWKGLQKFFIDHLMRPLFEAWLHEALMSRALVRLNGSSPLALMNENLYKDSVTWQGRRWAWVDPLKDMQANKLAIEMGVTTPSRVIRETGNDPEEVLAEYADDVERFAAVGVSLTGENDIMEVEADAEED